MPSIGDVSHNDSATGAIDELEEVVDGIRHILFSTYNCQIHHNAFQLFYLLPSLQGKTGYSRKFIPNR